MDLHNDQFTLPDPEPKDVIELTKKADATLSEFLTMLPTLAYYGEKAEVLGWIEFSELWQALCGMQLKYRAVAQRVANTYREKEKANDTE